MQKTAPLKKGLLDKKKGQKGAPLEKGAVWQLFEISKSTFGNFLKNSQGWGVFWAKSRKFSICSNMKCTDSMLKIIIELCHYKK